VLKYSDKRLPYNFSLVYNIAKVVKEVNPEIAFIHHDHARTATLEALTEVNCFAGGEPIELKLREGLHRLSFAKEAVCQRSLARISSRSLPERVLRLR